MTNTPRKFALSFAIAAICAAAPALAQPLPGPPPFAVFDQNSDGVITPAEFAATHEQRLTERAAAGMAMRGAMNPPNFADFDTNGDGRLQPDEFAALAQKRGRSGMNPGGMGAGLTEQEYNAHLNAHSAAGTAMRGGANPPQFADVDQNGDGRVSPEEFTAAHQMPNQNRPGMGMGPNGGMGRGMGRNMPSFADFDLNSDGSLTEKEFYEARANRIKERSEQGYPMRGLANAPSFAEIDRNGDGRVDPDEFAAAQMQHRQAPQR